MSEENENYIPYNLLLKGYENCTLKEKIIWLFYEIKQKIRGKHEKCKHQIQQLFKKGE